MQIHHIGYGIRGFYRLAKLGQLWDMIPEKAQHRLKVLRFWEKYGLEATREVTSYIHCKKEYPGVKIVFAKTKERKPPTKRIPASQRMRKELY